MKIFQKAKMNRGMTYVELIVVLSIFATISAVSFYNYGAFQANVDIKNLASDIALQIVQAQKASMNGQWDSSIADPNWKPSYGVFFNTATPTQFTYFTNSANSGYSMTNPKSILITKSNTKIQDIKACNNSSCSGPITALYVYFRRPDSGANFSTALASGYEYYQITIASPQTLIKIYPSGRIQVN